MSVKSSFLLVLCAVAVLALPAAASGPAAPEPTDAQGCQGGPVGAIAFDAPNLMTPAVSLAGTLPDPSPAEYCWVESRWTYAGYCCTKSWGLAAVLRLQERLCCQYTGCRSWENTPTTSCSGYPCP